MGRINTSIGLITGFPIQQTVDQLVALQGRPRDLLVKQNQSIEKQRTAVTQITALLIGFQFASRRLSSASLYAERSVSSSNEAALVASRSGEPSIGEYAFRPLQSARSQQLQSTRMASKTTPLGAGRLSFHFGGFVDAGLHLDFTRSGEGFERGKLRITDRSGASAEIDLSTARNVDDVLAAINNNATVNVTAEARGDRLRLVDNTGQTISNLKVQEVAGGNTAASLGLAGIDVAAGSALGEDVVSLFGDLGLDTLNGRGGVRLSDVFADFKVTHRDGTETQIDLHRLPVSGTKASAITSAANGANARVEFTAVTAGSALADVDISFVNDVGVVAGQESVAFDAQAKTLVFHIAEGQTTADQVIAALARNSSAAAAFVAKRAAGGNGTGVVTAGDSATTAGPKAQALSPETAGSEARIVFTAVHGGPQYDNVQIRYEVNDTIAAGQETVEFDGQELVFQIDEGNTTANQIIAALNNDPAASAFFTAESATGSNGTGVVQAADGTTTSGGAIIEPVAGGKETTLADVLATINAAAPGKLLAEIAPDGDRLLLTDLTSDLGTTFAVSAIGDSLAAFDLGLVGPSAGGSLSGQRLLGGFKSSLVRNLNGGTGFGDLGLVSLTDRAGASAVVDLAGAETLDEIVERLGASGVGISAQVNAARNGIELVDTSGGSGNLVIADGDALTQAATRLGLATDAATASKSSGSLRLATVNERTRLTGLGPLGISQGAFRIVGSGGETGTVTVDAHVETVGDLLDRINSLGVGVQARVNDAGDGIVLLDTLHGGGTISVTEAGGSTARDLRLLGPVKTLSIGGVDTQAIEGSTTHTIELDADDTLHDLAGRLDALGAGVRATIVNDGSPLKPFRLTLASQVSGLAGQLLVDSSELGFSLEETTAARDALLAVGEGGVLAASSSNTFSDLLPGVSLTVRAASAEPVVVSVGSVDDELTSAVQQVVDAYNRLREKLAELTQFDPETNQSAVLQGDGTTLRVESELAGLVSSRVFSAGPLQALAALGVSINDDGTLSLDSSRLKTQFAQSSTAVQDFFSKAEFGLADRVDKLVEQLAGVGTSLLVSRAEALSRKLETNGRKVEFMNARLEATRTRLLKRFQLSETLIAKLQANLTAIEGLAPMTPLGTRVA